MEDHVPPLVWTSPELFHFRNSVPSDEEDFEGEITVVESQLCRAMTDDEPNYSATERPTQHSLTTKVPGVGLVYKSTIISLMNGGGQQSKDQLTRVQQHSVTTTT